MPTSAESLADHWSFVFNISTRLLMGVYRYRVCCPVSRQLVTLQESSVKRYNKIIREQFDIHQIEERMDMVDKMTWYSGYPLPKMVAVNDHQIIQPDDRNQNPHRKNCMKILRLNNNFSLTIQIWYNRIQTYLQLIRMKEGKTNNPRNILQFAQHQHINKLEQLMMEEL
jgi:hypothetical protein